MSPNRKTADRRLANMSAAEPEHAWTPHLPPDGLPLEQEFPLGENARFIQRLSYDERGRLVEWAVIQQRRQGERWQHVAIYDICHGKGVHVHLYDRQGSEFTQRHMRTLMSYRDITDSLDDVVDGLVECWQENERRSDRGK